jgi:hypothetical protein
MRTPIKKADQSAEGANPKKAFLKNLCRVFPEIPHPGSPRESQVWQKNLKRERLKSRSREYQPIPNRPQPDPRIAQSPHHRAEVGLQLSPNLAFPKSRSRLLPVRPEGPITKVRKPVEQRTARMS